MKTNEKQTGIKCGKQDLFIESGKIAKQANGSVVVRYGGARGLGPPPLFQPTQ